ncbi:hypothetical protein [Limosilactobacillus reuteri]|nr:hypothetical protein [Limosilactobacillus reuteri]QIZ03449.1 hypothetical protein GXL24_10760 [Limosilactobacillus reuteri]
MKQTAEEQIKELKQQLAMANEKIAHYGGEVSAKDCQPTVGSATKIHY